MSVGLVRVAAPGRAPSSRDAHVADLFFLAGVLGIVGGAIAFGSRWAAPLEPVVAIDLRPRALVAYTLLSLGRGFAAYFLSLGVTLAYGTAAAHSARAARVLLPLLDVLQSIPVLGFLPGLVLGLVALVPHREAGLELACVIMIFTGQAWNMVFSFYASLRSIPPEMREAAAVFRLSPWQVFRTVELPSAAIGLVWNSMMSMAGGWFFLTVAEAFTLGDRDFRLPGVGSYMAVAIERGDTGAMVWGVVAMALMILATDQLVWRPLVAFVQQFKFEESAGGEVPRAWVLDVLGRSVVLAWLRALLAGLPTIGAGRPRRPSGRSSVGMIVGWTVVAVAAVVAGAGAYELGHLLVRVPAAGWAEIAAGLGATMLRTTAAVALAAAWTVPVGVLIGRSATASRRLQPAIQMLASFPAPMLYPFVTAALLFLDIPFGTIAMVLMLLGAQWYVLFNVIAGASAIPADLREAADFYRLRGWRRWRTLELPVVFPYLVTGLITAAGGAWNASIVAEVVIAHGRTMATTGLGALITQSTAAGDFPLLAASIVTMATAVVTINRLGWRRLYRLAETRYAITR